MDVPAGYRFRAPTADDLDAVAEVFVADDLEDGGEVVLDASFVGSVWSRAGFDLAADAWVIVDDGGTIGAYGHAMRDGDDVVESLGIVHPGHRGRGLGAPLLDRIEHHAVRLLDGVATPRFRHSINAGDTAAAAMLEARGLRPVRHFWHMGIDPRDRVERGRAPDGIEIRGVATPADLPAVHAVLTEAFVEDEGYRPEPFEPWAEDYASDPTHDPDLWLLATDGDVPVGALTAGTEGWIGEIGVVRSHRGRGIAAALLARSFETFAERGTPRVMLNVDAQNPTGATALYERAGMRIVKRWDLWERSSPDGQPLCETVG